MFVALAAVELLLLLLLLRWGWMCPVRRRRSNGWMLRTALAQLQARCRVLPCGWRCAMDGGRLLRLVHAVAQGKFVTGPAEWDRRAVRAWLSVVQTSVGVAE